jgi:hypothetical protein
MRDRTSAAGYDGAGPFREERRSGRTYRMIGSRLHPSRRFDRSTDSRPLALISSQAQPDRVLHPAGR